MPKQETAPAVCAHRAGPEVTVVGNDLLPPSNSHARTQPDHADEIAAKHYAELVNRLHALCVHWGDHREAHLTACRMRDGLAQTIRVVIAETKQHTIQEIRTQLRGRTNRE
jgi:hypothetical protein